MTFALISYNSESFIENAAMGALAQTYKPLELILSDDCSNDCTFTILEEIVGQYGGPHHIVLNRNEKNLGIGGHVNRIMELAHGEYVVIAAGDDISIPERTERLIDVFITNSKATAVFSDCFEFNTNGEKDTVVSAQPPDRFTELPEMCRHMFRGVTGATNSWHRSVFDTFGPMREDIVFEDRVIAFRAALLGNIKHVPLPLVKYRRHETNTVGMFHTTSAVHMEKRLECFRTVYLNNINDLRLFVQQGKIDPALARKCKRIMKRELRKLNGYIQILNGRSYSISSGIMKVLLGGGNPFYAIRALLLRNSIGGKNT